MKSFVKHFRWFIAIQVILFSLLLHEPKLFAQTSRTIQESFEISRNSETGDFILIPDGREKLYLIYLNDKSEWKLRIYNHMLELKQEKNLSFIESNSRHIKNVHHNDTIEIFFASPGKNTSLISLGICTKTNDVFSKRTEVGKRVQIADVVSTISDTYLYIKRRNRSGIIHISENGKISDIVPLSRDVRLNFSPYISGGDVCHAYTRIRSKNNIKYFMVKTQADGLTTGETEFFIKDDLIISRAYLVKNKQGRLICIGSYTTSYYSGMESGVFSLFPDENDTGKNQTFPFNQFQNSLIIPSQIRRINRARRRGREPEIRHMLLHHPEIVEVDEEYIFVSDVYFPQYTYEQRYNPYTRMFENYQVFNGYLYTHAMVCSFNQNGNLLWDNNIENNQVVSFSLRPLTTIHPDKSDLILMYPYDDNLAYKIINAYDVVERMESMNIRQDKTPGIVERSIYSDLKHWYDKNFIIYGIQRRRESGKLRKFDFFIRKIAYN